MSYVRLSSCIHGFHKYQAIWEPTHGEELDCCSEIGNTSDPYAVSVMKGREVVGHVPCKISRMCAVFMRNGGSIKCTVTVNRRYSCDLPQGGMEIPCLLRFFGQDKWLKKVSKLIEDLCFGDNSEGRGNSSENNDVSDIAEYELVKKQAKMDNDSIVIVDSPVQGEKEATINVWVQCDVCTLNFEDKKSLRWVWN